MKKEDLKTGMVVETRKGVLYLIIEDKLIGLETWGSLYNYFDNLKSLSRIKDCDIVKVYIKDSDFTINDLTTKTYIHLIWQRKEPP